VTRSIVFHRDEHYTETVYSPEGGLEALFETAAQTLALAQSNGCRRFLGDCRAMPFGGSAQDVRHLVTFIAASGIGPNDREALIVPDGADQAGNFRYFGELCHQRGITVQLFTTREQGLAWLLAS